jgi:cytochrome c-type biogenesis protein CcmH
MNSLFYILAAAMALLAVAFVLMPLLRRGVTPSGVSARQADLAIYEQRLDEIRQERDAGSITAEQYDQTRAELDRQLLVDTQDSERQTLPSSQSRSVVAAVLAAVLLPLTAGGLYWELGAGPAPEPVESLSPDDVEGMVRQLAQRLEREPDNGEGWLMLGRSYTVMGQPEKGIEALTRARRLLGDTPEVLVAYAQALAAGGEEPALTGMPAALLDQALEQAPNHQQALWLSGLAAAQARDPEKVLDRWGRLLQTLPPDSEDATMLRENLASLRDGMNQSGTPAPAESGSTTDSDAGVGVQVEVTLSDSLTDRASAGDTVFVFARAPGGPPMPLAVARHRVSELPLTITLDDGNAMMPGNRISMHEAVDIVARISASGNAQASSGDLQSPPVRVRPGPDASIQVVIDSVVP